MVILLQYYENMKKLSLVTMVLSFLAAGCCTVGCNSTKGAKVENPLVCQWTIITMQKGMSVVTDGNPTKKSVEELVSSGVGFSQRVEREMHCQPHSSGSSIKLLPHNGKPKEPKTKGTWVRNDI